MLWSNSNNSLGATLSSEEKADNIINRIIDIYIINSKLGFRAQTLFGWTSGNISLAWWLQDFLWSNSDIPYSLGATLSNKEKADNIINIYFYYKLKN